MNTTSLFNHAIKYWMLNEVINVKIPQKLEKRHTNVRRIITAVLLVFIISLSASREASLFLGTWVLKG